MLDSYLLCILWLGKQTDYKLLPKTISRDSPSLNIERLELENKKLTSLTREQDKKIALLERKLHRIGEAEEQRDWLLNELTKKLLLK